LKNINHQDPHEILDYIKKLENEVNAPAFEIERREDIKVNIRVDESINPAKFRPDPLIPSGFVANSLTIRAMRSDIFVLGESIAELSSTYLCACNKEFDLQFWKICPYCARSIHL